MWRSPHREQLHSWLQPCRGHSERERDELDGTQPTGLVILAFWLFMGAAVRSLPLEAPDLGVFSVDAAARHAGASELCGAFQLWARC